MGVGVGDKKRKYSVTSPDTGAVGNGDDGNPLDGGGSARAPRSETGRASSHKDELPNSANTCRECTFVNRVGEVVEGEVVEDEEDL